MRVLADLRGGIDVLVNNAALIVNKPFEAFSLDEYEEQVRVNSSAAFALVRAVAPGMKAKRAGRIVNFCSVTLNGQWGRLRALRRLEGRDAGSDEVARTRAGAVRRLCQRGVAGRRGVGGGGARPSATAPRSTATGSWRINA